MFGVVPKPLWEKRIAPDARNRIPLGMRCLLIEHDIGLVLIDTGAGNKENEEFHDIYGLENSGTNGDSIGRTNLEDAIIAAGHRIADVKLVINTHLHFDHAGGDTYIDSANFVRASFQRTRGTSCRRANTIGRCTPTSAPPRAKRRNWEPIREAEAGSIS